MEELLMGSSLWIIESSNEELDRNTITCEGLAVIIIRSSNMKYKLSER